MKKKIRQGYFGFFELETMEIIGLVQQKSDEKRLILLSSTIEKVKETNF
jgi:inactivated superfamily I helicase